MATFLHRVFENFKYVIENITPTSSLVRQRFVHFDPTYDENIGEGSGFSRSFYVEWEGSDMTTAATDQDRREAWHDFVLSVFYAETLPYEDMFKLIAQDRHDLIKALRADSNRAGFDDDHPSTELGLYNRYCEGDDLSQETEDSSAYWVLRQKYRCLIEEDEQ